MSLAGAWYSNERLESRVVGTIPLNLIVEEGWFYGGTTIRLQIKNRFIDIFPVVPLPDRNSFEMLEQRTSRLSRRTHINFDSLSGQEVAYLPSIYELRETERNHPSFRNAYVKMSGFHFTQRRRSTRSQQCRGGLSISTEAYAERNLDQVVFTGTQGFFYDTYAFGFKGPLARKKGGERSVA